jgi:nucleoside-diphosphate-sugar epimerase
MTADTNTSAVTGASGFIGEVLLERLASTGPTRVLHRRDDAWRARWRARGTDVVLGDLAQPSALEALVGGADTVYHCAATMQKGNADLSRRVNVDGTEALLRAAAAAGVRRLVYVSSISVYAATRRDGDILTEAVEPEHVMRLNAYGRTKYDGELVVRDLGRELGVPFTVIRPTNVYGPRSGPWFLQWERTLRTLPVAFGDVPIDVVYVDDVVDALIRAARSPAAASQVFNVGHEMVSMRQFVLAVARVSRQRAHTLPRVVDRLLRVAIDRGYRAFTRRYMSMSLVRPAYYPHLKAQALFGYAPRVTLEEGFERIARSRHAGGASERRDGRVSRQEECHA